MMQDMEQRSHLAHLELRELITAAIQGRAPIPAAAAATAAGPAAAAVAATAAAVPVGTSTQGELSVFPEYNGDDDIDSHGYGKVPKLRDELSRPYAAKGPI